MLRTACCTGFLLLAAASARAADDGWSTPFNEWRARFAPVAPVKAGQLATVTVEIQNTAAAARPFDLWSVFIAMPAFMPSGWLGASEGRAGPGAQPRSPDNPARLNAIGKQRFAQTHFLVQPGGTVLVPYQLPYVLPRPGDYVVTARYPTANPFANRMLVDKDFVVIPPVTIKVGPGDPAAEHAYDTYWGQARDGLRAGLQHDHGFRPTPLSGYTGWSLWVENATDAPITFTYTSGAEAEDLPLFVDARNQPHPAANPTVRVSELRQNTTEVKPHQKGILMQPGVWVIPPTDGAPGDRPSVQLSLGEYKATVRFRYKLAGAKSWSTLTSGEAPLTVIAAVAPLLDIPNLQAPDLSPWGASVEGVACRLHPTGLRGADPALAIDIRNAGKRQLTTTQDDALWQVQWDGTWYSWTGDIDAKSSALPPNRTYEAIPLNLDAPGWKTATGEALHLAPGRHVLRVSTTCAAEDGGPPVHVESNAIDVTIPPPKNAAPPAGGA
jgi:hypothetical protein